MSQKFPLPPKVLGQIILSKFLKRSPESYLKYINDVIPAKAHVIPAKAHVIPAKAHVIPAKAHVIPRLDRGIHPQTLPNARHSKRRIPTPNALAAIKKNRTGFAIYYPHKQMTLTYEINEKKEMNPYLRKLRLISTRNTITHAILTSLISYQKKYFKSENPFDFKPLTQRQLVSVQKCHPGSATALSGIPLLDPSRMSRLIDQKTIILPSGEEVSLKFLFATKKDIYKRHIKIILNQEKKELENEKIKYPYFDTELQKKLKERGIHISTRYISTLRAELGVAKALKRSMSRFPGQGFSFSAPMPLSRVSLEKSAPEKSGLYMLCIKPKEIEYPKGKTPIFYIGSSNNIKKRLKNHLSPTNKNGEIKNRLTQNACMFRTIALSGNWQHKEKTLYNLFMATYGARPKANRVSP